MKLNVADYPLGKYWSTLPNGLALGTIGVHPDLDYSAQPRTFLTGHEIIARYVKNTNASALTPGQLVNYDESNPLKNVLYLADGNLTTNQRNITDGVVDPWLDTTVGVPSGKYFWMITYGPCKFVNAATPATVLVKSRLIPDSTTAGAIALADTTTPQTLLTVGWALETNSSAGGIFRGFFQRMC
jgi:hypothetical protein